VSNRRIPEALPRGTNAGIAFGVMRAGPIWAQLESRRHAIINHLAKPGQ